MADEQSEPKNTMVVTTRNAVKVKVKKEFG
jgi:hypothetical protein